MSEIGKFIDLTGERFGRLTVIEYKGTKKRKKGNKSDSLWLCQCDCGTKKIIYGRALKDGGTKSCGCLRKEILLHKKHGMSNTRLFKAWTCMTQRCKNPNDGAYKNYGGRGITVCEGWLGENGFENFYGWAMKNGYSDDLTIDRINVNGDYEPSNCRWATMKEQQNNKRNNHIISLNGEEHTISEWSRITGINKETIEARVNRYGYTDEEALMIPIRGKRK